MTSKKRRRIERFIARALPRLPQFALDYARLEVAGKFASWTVPLSDPSNKPYAIPGNFLFAQRLAMAVAYSERKLSRG